MDIVADKFLRILALLFLPICLGAVSGGIVLAIRAERGEMAKARAKEIGTGIAMLAGGYLLLLVGTAVVLHFATKTVLDGMLTWKPNQLVMSSASASGNKRIEINDATTINELLRFMLKSDKVMAHHSHPTQQFSLFFPQAKRTYSLGRDSQNANEFWGPAGQFHSDELDRWLQVHWPSSAATSTNL